jgi:hypothetical protein
VEECGGSLPGLPGDGGEGEGGLVHPNPYHLPWVTRYSMSMLSPHDQGRLTLESPAVAKGPWTFFVAALGRSNKSSSEGDTFPRLVRRRVAAANHGGFFLALFLLLVPPTACSCLQQWPCF